MLQWMGSMLLQHKSFYVLLSAPASGQLCAMPCCAPLPAMCCLHAAHILKKLPPCTEHVAHSAFWLASGAMQKLRIEDHAHLPGCAGG